MRQPAPEPGDFLGLGMELSAKTRRDAAAEVRANELNPPPPPQPALPPLPNVQRATSTGSFQTGDVHANSVQPSNMQPSGQRSNSVPPAPTQARPMQLGSQSANPPPLRPRAPAAPTSMAGLMQPLPFEVMPQRYAEEPVRTNSWLLALDDARAGRAGAEPVVADPSNLLRAPRVAKPLDTSFSEPESVTQRSAPWLVGVLLATAACSLVFVFGSTLTHVDPAATHTKIVPPLGPDPRARTHEELSDPLDTFTAVSKHTRATNARPEQRPLPSATVMPPTNTTSSASNAPTTAPRSRPAPAEEPLSAPPQQDILVLPDPPSSDPAASDPPDLAPASSTGGGEQSSTLPSMPGSSIGATWWSGSLHATPLARDENGPDAEEYAASTERQAAVSQWLMRQSRGAAPRADTASVFPYIASNADARNSARSPASDHAPVIPAASAREPSATHDSEPAPVSIVWEGSTVPADRITANARLLTPQVGRVRADLRNGRAIEGKLYAVGTGSVWIDADIGRIALQRSEIARLEQIATVLDDTIDEGTEDTSAPATAAPALETTVAADAHATPATPTPKPAPAPEPPPRVRVRTPGGVFFGQIVAREGSTLTLLTDEGSRITLESSDVEAAPISKPVVKHVSAPAKKPAADGTPPEPH